MKPSPYHQLEFYKLSDFTAVLEKVGLHMDVKTGGFLAKDRSFTVSSSRYGGDCKLTYKDGTEVSILDGHIFLESLKHTESSFKIKLFVS
ncbi:MAG: hypothetical protein CMP21_00130 [Rickettsiales bacterium]|nr:hypothetical protein [Rickettsiales bacterium]|tara:strand:+ start:2734 stop:3003 length:270 start_codon:yes stop_codon:yes gene_type:complete